MSGPGVKAKICGINSPAAMAAAVAGGAAFVGLVFFPPSPRALTLAQARALAAPVPSTVRKVGLFVDPGDDIVAAATAAAALNMLQLHGTETPDRVAALRARFGLPVMKAIGVGDAADLAAADAYVDVADWLLFDARPPGDAVVPGGNARAFDWTVLAGLSWPRPWMLAGGIDAANVAAAVTAAGADCVDTSSGVESARGHKDPALITAFLNVVATL